MRAIAPFKNILSIARRTLSHLTTKPTVNPHFPRTPSMAYVEPLPKKLKELYSADTQDLITYLLCSLREQAEASYQLAQFMEALNSIKSDPTKLSPELLLKDELAARYYATIAALINIGAAYKPPQTTTTEIDFSTWVTRREIRTIHPSGLVPDRAFNIVGSINDELDKQFLANSTQPSILNKLTAALLDAMGDPLPVRYIDAITTTQRSVLTTTHAVAELAAKQHAELNPRQLLEIPLNWTLDQDRSGLPPESAGLAPFVAMQESISYLAKEVSRILAEENPGTRYRMELQVISHILKAMHEKSEPGWRAGKTLGALFVLDHEATHPSAVKIIEQLFAKNRDAVKPFLDVSVRRFRLTGLSKSKARSTLEKLLIDAYREAFIRFPTLKIRLAEVLKEHPDPANKDHQSAKVLLNLLEYGLVSISQGRVDGPGVAEAVDALLAREIAPELSFANLTEKIQHALMKRQGGWSAEEIEEIEEESAASTIMWETAYYFWMLHLLNSVTPGKALASSVIIANFEKEEHFWALLYLLNRSNSVGITAIKPVVTSIADLKVTYADINIGLLAENQKGFEDAVLILEKSLQNPLFNSYWAMQPEIIAMAAASDSWRQLGPMAAAFYTLVLEKRLANLLQKYLPTTPLVFQIGKGSRLEREARPTETFTATRNALRRPTEQPGPDNLAKSSRSQFLAELPSRMKPLHFQEFDEAFITYMKAYLQPGIDLLQEWIMKVDNRFDALLKRRQEMLEVVLYRRRGFRSPKLSLLDPATQESFMASARTISAVELSRLLALNVNAILSVVGRFRSEYADPETTREQKLALQRKLYRENPYYQAACHNDIDQLESCNPKIWDSWQDPDQSLIDELKSLLAEAKTYLAEVTEGHTLSKEPKADSHAAWLKHLVELQNAIYQKSFQRFPVLTEHAGTSSRDTSRKSDTHSPAASILASSRREASRGRRIINQATLFGKFSAGYIHTIATQHDEILAKPQNRPSV